MAPLAPAEKGTSVTLRLHWPLATTNCNIIWPWNSVSVFEINTGRARVSLSKNCRQNWAKLIKSFTLEQLFEWDMEGEVLLYHVLPCVF